MSRREWMWPGDTYFERAWAHWIAMFVSVFYPQVCFGAYLFKARLPKNSFCSDWSAMTGLSRQCSLMFRISSGSVFATMGVQLGMVSEVMMAHLKKVQFWNTKFFFFVNSDTKHEVLTFHRREL